MIKLKFQKGFTLTEFIIGVFIFAIAIGMAIPNFGCFTFFGAPGISKEAQVKSNIHSIQIGLERYAVDTGGVYPLILYGGDETDTFATYDSYVKYPPMDVRYYATPNEPGGWRGDVDALLQFGYLNQYPQNPFVSRSDPTIDAKIITNPGANGFEPLEIKPGRVSIWTNPRDRGREYIRRKVGGKSGNLMWDVSEGQRHPPWPIIIVPEPEPGHYEFTNPDLGNISVTPSVAENSHQFPLNQGNFYYYAVFDSPGGYSSFLDTNGDGKVEKEFPVMGNVSGYYLCGYGGIRNTGLDLYNLFGDYTPRSLNTLNRLPSDAENELDLYVGPDGRPDGAIIEVTGGVAYQVWKRK